MGAECAGRIVLVLGARAGKKMAGADTANHDTSNVSDVRTFAFLS